MTKYEHITKEQQEQWDNVPWEGLINADGPAAYQYVCNKLRYKLFDGGDCRTWLVMGPTDSQVAFLKTMQELGAIDEPDGEPWLACMKERVGNDGELYASSCESEDDTEHAANFIRNCGSTSEFYPIGGVILLNVAEGDLKHVDKLLKVPKLMNGSTTFIKVPVIALANTDGYSDFAKADDSTIKGVKRTIELIRADQITPKSVDFLVPDFVVRNAPNGFTGEMDSLKSTTALDIAAAGSCWRTWFAGTKNDVTPFITLFAGAEDDFSTTVVPRYMAAGGNRDCLYGVPVEVKCEQQTADGVKEYSTPLSFGEHLELLANSVQSINRTREWKVGLLINDPIISFFGSKNYNSPQDARDIMSGLKKFCEELQVTVINICHFNKTLGLTSKQKTSGSKALIEAHRQVWAFDRSEDDKNIVLVAPVKHNLLKDARSYKITSDSKETEWEVGGGFYQKTDVGVIRFVGYSNMTADERIEEKESKDRGSRKELKKAILTVLKDGPVAAGQVCNALQDLGVSTRTIQRAAEQLEDEGKLRKSGTNHKNFVWQLTTEVEQATFDEVTTNGRV